MHPSPVPARIPASQAAFLDDVGRVLITWRRTPLLPAAVLAVGLVQVLAGTENQGLAVLGGLVGLLLVGWPGAERLWYLRVWTGRTLTLGEAAKATMRCFGRFFVLALVVGGVGAVLAIPLFIAIFQAVDLGDDGTVTFGSGLPLWATAYGALLGLLGYALLTFVTPAIVYSSKRVRDAIPIGLRLLRVSWPRTAAYVLVPAVLAGLPAFFLGVDLSQPPTPLLGLLSTLVLALGRGSVAAYYLRTVPGAGPDGAVQLEPQPGYYPPPTGW